MMVVFSGGGTAGHFYPALNLAEALARLRPGVRPYFVGTEGRIEARELPRTDYEYRLLRVSGLSSPLAALRRPGGGIPERLTRLLAASVANVRAIWRLLVAVATLAPTLRRRRAAAVVVTGGYASAPAGIVGRLLGIPVVVQEQNTHPGKTTRLVSRWARQIHLAYPGAAAALPPSARRRVLHTGNPIRPPPAGGDLDREEARRALGAPTSGRLVLIVGGSQGADAINRATIQILSGGLLSEREFVLWATGRAHFDLAEAALAGVERERFRAVPYLEPAAMYRALAAADLAVSRAGAMATSEFLAFGLPAVLVPLPTAAGDHQSANARSLEAAGAVVHLPERDETGTLVSGERLWRELRRLFETPGLLDRMGKAARRIARPDAATEIAAAIATLLSEPQAEARP